MVIGLLLAQLFVNPDYTSLFRSWATFKVNTLVKIWDTTQISPTIVPNNLVIAKDNQLHYYANERVLTLIDKNSPTIIDWRVNKQKNLIAVLQSDGQLILKVFNLPEGQLLLEKKIDGLGGTIVHWSTSASDLYIAVKVAQENWQLKSINPEGAVKSLLENIPFPGNTLVKMLDPIDKFILIPMCKDECYFVTYDVLNNKVINHITTSVDTDRMPQSMENIFYDNAHDRIVFKTISENEEYVLAFDSLGKLWHKVYLFNNSPKYLETKGFRQSNKGLELLAYSPLRHELYLYDLSHIGLQIIKLNQGEGPVDQTINTQNSLFTANKDTSQLLLRNIHSHEIDVMGIDSGEVVAW